MTAAIANTAAGKPAETVAEAPAVFLKMQRNKFLPAYGKLVEAPIAAPDAKPVLSKAQRKYKQRAEAKGQAAAQVESHVGGLVTAAQPPSLAAPTGGQRGPTRAQKKKAKWDTFKAQQTGAQQTAPAATASATASADGQSTRTKGAAFSPGAVKFPSNADKKWAKKQAKMALETARQVEQEHHSKHAQQEEPSMDAVSAFSTDFKKEVELPAVVAVEQAGPIAPSVLAVGIANSSRERPGKRQRVGVSEGVPALEPSSRGRPTIVARHASGSQAAANSGSRAAGGGSGAAGDGSGAAGGGSQLLDKMRAQLQGGRFRWLNEQLYTTPGEESFDLLQVLEGLCLQDRHYFLALERTSAIIL